MNVLDVCLPVETTVRSWGWWGLIDEVCQHCFTCPKEILSSSTETRDETDEAFLQEDEVIRYLNRYVELSSDVALLKPPFSFHKCSRWSYKKSKWAEIESVMVMKISSTLIVAYAGVRTTALCVTECQACAGWLNSLKKAYQALRSYRECLRLLTIKPHEVAKKCVQEAIPAVAT